MTKQAVTILGSTGSIGTSTLDVLGRHADKFEVFALTANSSDEILAEQCQVFNPKYAVLRDENAAERLKHSLQTSGLATEVLAGEAGLLQVANDPQSPTVMAAIVGGAGLPATLAAVKAGKKVLLANKESLVMAGGLFMDAVREHGATLLPIDSEHNAIFQCLPGDEETKSQSLSDRGIRRILLTASGGPFLDCPLDDLQTVTPDQACDHPNWSMGRKISVDSATMMNKGLELIEACWLFDVTPEQIEVVIHPQSVIHSMVDYVDGSVLAQLGNPDMRTPIAHALAWPQRMDSGVSSLDLIQQGQLSFSAPDLKRFPCLALAMEAAKAGNGAQIALNAANEIAVDGFLEGQLNYLDIPVLIEKVLQDRKWTEPQSLEQVHECDQSARGIANKWLKTMGFERDSDLT